MGSGRAARLRRRAAAAGTRRAAAVGAATAALLAAGALALQLGGSGDGATAGTSAGGGGGTGKVERRTLAERLTATGTIDYAGETPVLARLSGTVTWLPAVGDVVRRGERLYALDAEPVLLMYGAVPAYRDLAEGVEDGADVEQLEEGLAALGYEPGTVDREFTSTTAAAVSDWQEDLGLEASGELELGRVAFLPGPRRVTAVEATLGEAIGGGGGAVAAPAQQGAATLVAYEVGAAEEAAAAEATEAEAGEGKPAEPDGEEDQPRGQEEPQRQQPAEQGQASSGPPAEAGSATVPGGESEASDPASVPILKAGSTERVVSVELDPDQQSVAWRGQRVEVLLPGGEEARGVVRRIAATEAGGGGAPGEEPEPGLEVTVSLLGGKKVPALEGAAVSVLFTQNVREQVLSVPLTALIAIGGERFAVYVREAGARRRIVVTPGLAADGYVEVEGRGLRAGMTVETGR